MKCPGCHRQMIETIWGGLGCPCLGTERCISTTNHLEGNRIVYHRPPYDAWKTFLPWGGSLFGHPEVPVDAVCCVSYSRDPSFDEYICVEYFAERGEAAERRKGLRGEGFCTAQWDRHLPLLSQED